MFPEWSFGVLKVILEQTAKRDSALLERFDVSLKLEKTFSFDGRRADFDVREQIFADHSARSRIVQSMTITFLASPARPSNGLRGIRPIEAVPRRGGILAGTYPFQFIEVTCDFRAISFTSRKDTPWGRLSESERLACAISLRRPSGSVFSKASTGRRYRDYRGRVGSSGRERETERFPKDGGNPGKSPLPPEDRPSPRQADSDDSR